MITKENILETLLKGERVTLEKEKGFVQNIRSIEKKNNVFDTKTRNNV